MQDKGGSNSWFTIRSLEYCLDFKLSRKTKQVKLVVRKYRRDPADADSMRVCAFVVMLVSSFFLLVVLVVYCLLPELQNLMGLVLIAYILCNLVATFVEFVLLLSSESLTRSYCKISSPMLYFTLLSTVFWMNVMSFDVWWLLRSHRKKCDINRRDERVKFMWYCLYAWGIPLLMTAIVTIIDNIDLSNYLHIIKPPFDYCLIYGARLSVQYYYDIPIGVIIFVNMILLSLTVYNIWMTKRAVTKCQDSKSSTQDTNRFVTYIKLFVVMGVSLILDIIPVKGTWRWRLFFYIYNQLTGVLLFFLFVFNKRIFFKLCKRFNINISSREPKLGNRTTRTTKVTTKNETHEMDLFKNHPEGENMIE